MTSTDTFKNAVEVVVVVVENGKKVVNKGTEHCW